MMILVFLEKIMQFFHVAWFYIVNLFTHVTPVSPYFLFSFQVFKCFSSIFFVCFKTLIVLLILIFLVLYFCHLYLYTWCANKTLCIIKNVPAKLIWCFHDFAVVLLMLEAKALSDFSRMKLMYFRKKSPLLLLVIMIILLYLCKRAFWDHVFGLYNNYIFVCLSIFVVDRMVFKSKH